MMFDGRLALAGLIVGFIVGLTGMGGGALMTPILILVFRMQPLAAISSDLVASFFMKPIGALVHLRRRTVNGTLVGWLSLGSVPSAFAGVLVLRLLGGERHLESVARLALGAALLVAAVSIVLRDLLATRRRGMPGAGLTGAFKASPLAVVSIGIIGGLMVGMTSVGSGSLIIAMLMLLYPAITATRLVGTDLVQAIPLVGSAALGHLLLGDFRLEVTASLLIGAIPGVFIGARTSAWAPASLVKWCITVVLLTTSLKLLGLPTVQLAFGISAVILATGLWLIVRGHTGYFSTKPQRVQASQHG